MLSVKSCITSVRQLGATPSIRSLDANKLGLDDPKQDNDDHELISEIRQLPSDDPLPIHLEEYERRKPLIQMEVSSCQLHLRAF